MAIKTRLLISTTNFDKKKT